MKGFKVVFISRMKFQRNAVSRQRILNQFHFSLMRKRSLHMLHGGIVKLQRSDRVSALCLITVQCEVVKCSELFFLLTLFSCMQDMFMQPLTRRCFSQKRSPHPLEHCWKSDIKNISLCFQPKSYLCFSWHQHWRPAYLMTLLVFLYSTVFFLLFVGSSPSIIHRLCTQLLAFNFR